VTALQAPPLALYIHLPWCVRKCPYCDFNSHAREGRIPEDRYVAALLNELDGELGDARGRELVSCFFGGGTPSLFSPAAIERLLVGIRARLDVARDAEITLEANPGTVEHGRFAEYRAAGVTRVSLGGQSFNARHLQTLGRIHSADETRRAVAELATAGIGNFNIDLMYGLPDQDVAEALADVEAALELGPAHLSHYQLTLEPGTVFFHRPPVLPDDDACWEMQLCCQARLADAGFDQYEISGYARPGRRCLHNLNYWQFGDYLGIGAGAHGKVTDPVRGVVERTAAVRQPRQYLDSFAPEGSPRTPAALPTSGRERHAVAAEDLPFEFMLNALRLIEGFTQEQFESRTGQSIEGIRGVIAVAESKGLLEEGAGAGYRPSGLGLRFLNDLQASFLPAGRRFAPAQEANPR